jgi:mRNA interferase MazF
MVARKPPAPAKRAPWVPDRQEIIWIDCHPQGGSEMRDIHPVLVLSPRIFNAKTALVIGLPMTTAEYNADNPFAVTVGPPKRKWLPKPATCSATNPSLLIGICAKPKHTP